MNKETLIAASVGLGLGLIVTVGVYGMKRSLTPDNSNQLSVSPTPASSNNSDMTSNLNLTAPEDGTLVTEAKVTVKGSSLARASIVILVGNDDVITTADGDGNFSQVVTLKSGPNLITVVATNENGESSQVERLVVLENLMPEVTASPAAKTTPTPTLKVTPKPTAKVTPSPTTKPKTSITPTPTKKL